MGPVSSVTRFGTTALLAAAALVVATTMSSPTANAQGIGSIELVAQSSWIDDGGIFNAQVRVAGADPDSSVIVRVFPPWSGRAEFLQQDYLQEPPLLELEPIVLSEQQETSNEVLPIELEVIGPSAPARSTTDDEIGSEDPDAPPVLPQLVTEEGSGVYPVEISLVDPQGVVLDFVLTSLIELPRQSRSAALQTAFVLEAPTPSAVTPDAESTLTDQEIAELKILVDAIAQHPVANVAIAINAETLVGLERSTLPEAGEVLALLQESLSSEQLLTTPFANVEEQAWINAGLTTELQGLYEAGSLTSSRLIGVQHDPRVMLLDQTVTSEGLAHFARHGVEGVIVRPSQVSALDERVFTQALTTRFLIPADSAEPVPALVADSGLTSHFTSEGGTAERANRMLADLTLLSLQNSDLRQAVVVTPPQGWDPDPTFLNVVLSGLERIPVVAGATPLDALSNTAFTPSRGIGTLSPPLRRILTPRQQPTELLSYRTDFSQAASAIDSWTTVIPSDASSTQRLDELLQLSTNASLDSERRQSYINTVYEVINEQKADSITTPSEESITLTGRRSQVPIIVENNLTVDASVLFVLDSEKLAFPEGRELEVVLTPGSNRIEIPIEVRASGDSPIRIQIFSPDRSVLLGTSEILVRAFVFSGVGLIIGVLAIIVLVIWWLRHWRASRVTVDETLPAPPSEVTEEPLGV